MFNWLKRSKKSPPSGKIVRRRTQSATPAQNPEQASEVERKLQRLGVLKQSEQETVRAIRQYVRDHPKQAAQLLSLWLQLAEQRTKGKSTSGR